MTLVFLSRSRLPVQCINGNECNIVADKYGVTPSGIAQALEQLEGSFLVKREESNQQCWGFYHPTFADAISGILSSRPDLVELYLKGAKIETLLGEVVCVGATPVKDAVLVPEHCFDTLVDRLLETPNEKGLNEQLFKFIDRRASRRVVECMLKADPSILSREGSPNVWLKIGYQSEVLLHAKAHSMGLLSDEIRWTTCDSLKSAALNYLDISFLSNELILKLFQPLELVGLILKLVAMLERNIPLKIVEIEEHADPDLDIDFQFEEVETFVTNLHSLASDVDFTDDRLRKLEADIEVAKSKVLSRKSDEDSDSFFAKVPSAAIPSETVDRSIFSDIDE